MPNRRRLAREVLEIYLVHLIMAYRQLILISGLLFLGYAAANTTLSPAARLVCLLPAIFLLLLGTSYNAALYTAKLGAWIGTLWRKED